jgi:hypothetical protein
MDLQLFTNAAKGTMSGTLAQGGTTMVLSSGEGNKLPAPTAGQHFILTIFEKDGGGNEERVEVVTVTSRTADTLTLGARDYEGTVGVGGGYAYPSSVGKTVYWALRLTAAGAAEFMQVASIHAATGKTTPADADELPLSDSAASFGLKKLTFANLKAAVKTYFDALYAALVHSHAIADTTGLQAAIDAKQATLVSGTNIKTVNSNSLVGSGNVVVGDVAGQAASVDSELALFSGTGGKTIKRATTSGVLKAASGVLAAATAGTDYVAPGTATTFTAQQTFKEVKDTVHAITDGAAFEIDPANGSVQTVTLGANRTPKATNFEAGQVVLLGIDDGAAYTFTWTDATLTPTWVKPGGTGAAPTLATTGYTWVLLWKVGSTIYGAEVGKP